MHGPVTEPHSRAPAATAGLTVATLGIVYGDIGTSPLYALREAFLGGRGIEVVEESVLGVCSLIVWALVTVISVKYLALVMRADNHGEGGLLALLASIDPRRLPPRTAAAIVAVGLFGTALLYGDGMITPAISVLSAVEGFEVAASGVEPYVVPIAAAILVALFAVQHRGTGAVGAVFGPIMVVWFSVLGILGLSRVLDNLVVLRSLWPGHGIAFLVSNPWSGFVALGSVFLVVTGGEALYADMGHFGRGPIARGWFKLVFPALALNYLGQGALLLEDPEVIDTVFYELAPDWGVVPLAVLATMATVIASQALISGAFSLTAQAIQLGYSPRMRIEHTSRAHIGQIYVPAVNWALLVSCLVLVFGFRSSSNLAAAYGIAVSATMGITTGLLAVVAHQRWGWRPSRVAAICVPLLVVDLAFFGANALKFLDGGWFPLVVGLAIFALFTTWRRGRVLVAEITGNDAVELRELVAGLEANPPERVPGTAVYMHRLPDIAPPALLTNLRSNHVLHEEVVVLTVRTATKPTVPAARKVKIEELGCGLFKGTITVGFVEHPDLPAILANVVDRRVSFRPEDTTYFLGHEAIIPSGRPGMALWRDRLFALMTRNATPATRYYGLPAERAVEIGQQVEI